MCGIFGMITINNLECFNYGINGLKQLQNRGYDSAGCCAIINNNFILEKYASHPNIDSITSLENKKECFNKCTNGIFHTRWATHGGKTDINAHPHLDHTGSIAVVHNGIIENYYELKLELNEKYNIKLKSETDTEIIVNLISVNYYMQKNKNMEEAILKTVNKLKGTWGLVVLCTEEPDNMYCIRHGSPLLIGFSTSYVMVTSEQSGFGDYVNNYVCLDNNEITVIKRRNNKIKIENIDNYDIKKIF
jgi:glucosamine--fructose-6-phosphate aminotransferase (isomerizing)